MSRFQSVKDEPGVTLPRNDGEKWIAFTYAIWSEYCGGSCQYLGGYEKTSANAKMIAKVLEEDWMITDHKSGVEMVEYLLENAGSDGDDEDFDEDDMDEETDCDEYDEESYDEDEEDSEYEDDEYDDDEYDDDEYDEYEDYDVDTTAFDYACVCNMCGRMFIAGYLTREESIQYASEAAKKIQELYSSWEEFYQAYIIGASGGDLNDAQPFIEAYQQVKSTQNSPFHLDWDTSL